MLRLAADVLSREAKLDPKLLEKKFLSNKISRGAICGAVKLFDYRWNSKKKQWVRDLPDLLENESLENESLENESLENETERRRKSALLKEAVLDAMASLADEKKWQSLP